MSVVPQLMDLKRYLLRQGWQQIRHPNPRIEMFQIEDASVTVPTSSEFRNSEGMINEAIEIIAAHEKITAPNLVARLWRWGSDTLLARLFKIRGDESSIPLLTAAEVIGSLKDFVGYAAYTQSEPKPFFDRAGGISNDFASLCRFGHTFQGSFGLTIECPVEVPAALALRDVEPIVPFERKVFDRIASGLSLLRISVSEDNLTPMIEGYRIGFSANMCRALAATYEQVDGRRIEYNVLWSPQLESPVEREWRPFIFEGRAYEFTKAAAAELEGSEVFADSLIEGRITALRSDQPPAPDWHALFEHIITMSWEREKGQTVGIKIPLSPSEYILACDAHKDGRRIRIYGVPEKSGKLWFLTRTHDFAVLL